MSQPKTVVLRSAPSTAGPAATATGQFRSDGNPDALGIGTQRRFTSLSGNVLYALPSATDFTPATFGPVEVTQAASTVGFAVDVEDNAGGAAGVKRVFALYRDESGSWRKAEMSHSSPRWSGAGPLVGTTVEWFIQAVDATGNVAVTSNKSVGRSVTPVEPTGDIEVELTGQQANGWYTGNVAATISGAPGISYSLDGAAFTPGTSLTVTGTDIHSLDFQGSDGSHGSVAVPIDDSLPTVTVNDSYGFGQIAHAVCADSGSGIASCTVPDPLDTSSAGPKTISVRAEDRAGHVFEGSVTYQVRPNPFIGFFSPVDNPPIVNVSNAGSSVPVKFSLNGFQGLDVLWPGFPASQQTSCTGGALDDLEEIAPPGESEFSYDPATNRYKFVWKTDRGWRGTCRQLVVRLRDGSEKRANFRFR